jgi:hypothetical protein
MGGDALRHVRDDAQLPAGRDEGACVVGLVRGEGDPSWVLRRLRATHAAEHGQGRLTLREAGRVRLSPLTQTRPFPASSA